MQVENLELYGKKNQTNKLKTRIWLRHLDLSQNIQNNINDGWVLFSCYGGFMSQCHDLLVDLNRTEPLLTSVTTSPNGCSETDQWAHLTVTVEDTWEWFVKMSDNFIKLRSHYTGLISNTPVSFLLYTYFSQMVQSNFYLKKIIIALLKTLMLLLTPCR